MPTIPGVTRQPILVAGHWVTSPDDVPTYRIDHMPYGGVKDSGLGREGLRWAIEDMTELRLLVLGASGPGAR